MTTSCLTLARTPPETSRYVLDVTRPGSAVQSTEGPRLEVRSFHAASAYGARKFVYRTSEHEVDTDFYHELLVPPAVTIGEATRRWFAASGRFATAHAGSAVSPDWTLEGDLVRILGDYQGDPKAELAVHITVVKRNGSEVVLDRLYSASEAMPSTAPEELVAGWSRGLAKILTDLEAHLAAAI